VRSPARRSARDLTEIWGVGLKHLTLSACAPLPAEVQALWQVWGVNLKNLYGQTEAGVVTAQFDSFPPPGAVGRPYPDAVVTLGADDEIVAPCSADWVH
jgi:long-subunit acyl-CoA synthetase (AMP-forming)